MRCRFDEPGLLSDVFASGGRGRRASALFVHGGRVLATATVPATRLNEQG
jgi:hypothetical protein